MADYRKNFKKSRHSNGQNQRTFGNAKSPVYELRIEKMVQGGGGMARLEDGRVCFVSGALPGELCKVRLTFQKKDFTKGIATEILEASPDRVKPKCPLYGKCGGCSLQHLSSDRQVAYMEQVERENFRRLAHAELPADFKIHHGSAWGYRNRARVVYRSSKNGAEGTFGFREQESNGIVTFKECPVLTPALNEFLQGPAKQMLAAEKSAERATEKFARMPAELDVNIFDNGKGEVSYYYRGMKSADFQKNAVSVVEVLGKEIQADASVFFQSNLGLLPQLVESVRRAVDASIASGEASDQWLIDLFSGVGFFAAILQDKFKKITTVEREEGCLKHAKVNLGGKAENISAPAEDWLAQNVVDTPATLIVDPPRTGLPKEALDAIVASSVNRLIYVSCDPVTLARDYSKFAQAGFSLKHAEGFAFYPQTPHLEMMFVLSR